MSKSNAKLRHENKMLKLEIKTLKESGVEPSKKDEQIVNLSEECHKLETHVKELEAGDFETKYHHLKIEYDKRVEDIKNSEIINSEFQKEIKRPRTFGERFKALFGGGNA